jgi:hypothetical protein
LKKRQWLTVLVLSLTPFLLRAQSENVAMGNHFKFRDGLFLNFEQFQQNQPGLLWEEVMDKMVSTRPGIFKVETLLVGDVEENEPLPLDSVWGFAYKGAPYVRVPQDTSDDRRFATFVALRLIGKICFFSYEREREREVVIRAYNPLTGRPFREGAVKQKETVVEDRIIYFPTGETADMKPAVVAKWIEDDPELWSAFDNLGPRPDKEDLYQTIVMYNERNRVYTFR